MKKSKPICICLVCGKSSNAGNQCAYEEKKFMAACPTYIKIKPKKETTKK
jgi:hypothetical protein